MKRVFLSLLSLVIGLLLFSCDQATNPEIEIQKPYTEGDVYVSGMGLMHYYFSSTPEGIEQAAFDNGISYINPPIKNAPWLLNPTLDVNVKNATDSRGVSYSGTVYRESGVTYIVINRKLNSLWYSTLYTLT